MQIVVNGEPKQIPDGLTVAGLIDHLGLSRAICAAEVNRAVVPRAQRGETVLNEGDIVEVVTLVGGG